MFHLLSLSVLYEISEMKLKMVVEEDNVASQNVSTSAAT